MFFIVVRTRELVPPFEQFRRMHREVRLRSRWYVECQRLKIGKRIKHDIHLFSVSTAGSPQVYIVVWFSVLPSLFLTGSRDGLRYARRRNWWLRRSTQPGFVAMVHRALSPPTRAHNLSPPWSGR